MIPGLSRSLRNLFSPALISQRFHLNERAIHLLAYNLLRTVMWEAGTTYKVNPLRLSLQGTRQHLDNFIPQLAWASNQKRVQLYQVLLETIAHRLVPQRQGRCESRVRKRRSKAYPLMTKPRQILHQDFLLLTVFVNERAIRLRGEQKLLVRSIAGVLPRRIKASLTL